MSRIRVFKTIMNFNTVSANLLKRNYCNLNNNDWSIQLEIILSFNFVDDKRLFTPGPLSTSLTVKQAMLKDLGSRDNQFIDIIKFVQQKTLDIASKIILLD